jgi:hypothetical protein
MDWKQVVERGESPNVDFKAATSWDGEDRVRLAKAIVAMANTRDGGVLIIGVDDDRQGGKPRLAGVTPDQRATFDPTKVSEFINSRFEPQIRLRIEKPVVDGCELVVVVVQEFTDEPLICVGEGLCNGKMLFKPGDLLVRTASAQSMVAGPKELRELLGRAVARKGEHLLEQMRRIVNGSPAPEEQDWQTLLSHELTEWRDVADNWRKKSRYGGWIFTLAPTEPPLKQYRHAELAEFIRQTVVSLRGWYFPGGRASDAVNRSGKISHEVLYNGFIERWELFQRLVFGDFRSFWEDGAWLKEGDTPGTELSFVNIIYTVAEFVLFAKRLYSAVGYEGGVAMRVHLTGCSQRRLVSKDFLRHLGGGYVCQEPEIYLERTVHTADLAAGWEEYAADFAEQVFALFNWSNPSRGMIEKDIASLRDRRI